MVKGLVIVVILGALIIGGFKYLPSAFEHMHGVVSQHQVALGKV